MWLLMHQVVMHVALKIEIILATLSVDVYDMRHCGIFDTTRKGNH